MSQSFPMPMSAPALLFASLCCLAERLRMIPTPQSPLSLVLRTAPSLTICVGLLTTGSALADDARCGYYAVLGCADSEAVIVEKQDILRNLTRDGTTRTKVIHTDNFSNFRDGWFCLVDGPFETYGQADTMSLDWGETVGPSYAKKGC